MRCHGRGRGQYRGCRGRGSRRCRALVAWPERAESHDDVPYFWSDQYHVKVQMLGVPADYDAIEVIEGCPDGGEFVAAYGRDGQTVAVLATIPNRMYGCRDAIAERAEFPPRRPV